ncbi:MAG: 4-phosphopantetheinyl transferase [Flavobacterium sp. BFFFF2]|nr:MAG: 4-phosphopantetheinyl transferase [Flavobacterium sp. BFFFF2]
MPIVATFTQPFNTRIHIWHCIEPENELLKALTLTDRSLSRLQQMKSESHRMCFLAVRQILLIEGFQDGDLIYDENGKPSLKNGLYVSISHSHLAATLAISEQPIGVDIELIRDKIANIDFKFSSEPFLLERRLSPNYISELTVVWGVKEALFKIVNQVGISYKNDILVSTFEITDGQTKAVWTHLGLQRHFNVSFAQWDQWMLVWVFEI